MHVCRRLALGGLIAVAAILAGCDARPGVSVDYFLLLQRDVPVDLDEPTGARAEAEQPGSGWLWSWPGMGKPIGVQADEGPAEPSTQAKPAHWRERRGPAYEDDWLRTLGRDAKEMPLTMLDDARAMVTDPWSLLGFAAAGTAGIVINASGSDNRVGDHFQRHGPQLNTFWDSVGDVGGNPGAHFALAGAMYFASLAREDVKAYETSKTLLNALALNGLTTLALKGAARTHSPNGDPCGWPSGHTSSSFCLATVMHETYGPWVGLPLFAFAGYVGYERIDASNHDFSDVISGALIGMAIGHAVTQNHKPRIFGFEVIPYADPQRNSIGVALAKRF